jgi:hypothetical protein
MVRHSQIPFSKLVLTLGLDTSETSGMSDFRGLKPPRALENCHLTTFVILPEPFPQHIPQNKWDNTKARGLCRRH